MWKPLDDRILVVIEKAPDTTTPGGLVLPGTVSQDKFTKRGAVQAVGRNVRGVSVGDTVLFSGYSGNAVPDDDDARLLREGEVLGVLA